MEMKAAFNKLNDLVRDGAIDVNDFYNITFTESDFSFQGYPNAAILKKYVAKGYVFSVNVEGHIVAEQNDIRLVFI